MKLLVDNEKNFSQGGKKNNKKGRSRPSLRNWNTRHAHIHTQQSGEAKLQTEASSLYPRGIQSLGAPRAYSSWVYDKQFCTRSFRYGTGIIPCLFNQIFTNMASSHHVCVILSLGSFFFFFPPFFLRSGYHDNGNPEPTKLKLFMAGVFNIPSYCMIVICCSGFFLIPTLSNFTNSVSIQCTELCATRIHMLRS